MTTPVATMAGALMALALAAGATPAVAQAPANPVPVTSAPQNAPNEPTTSYIVKKGDTLWALGDKYFIRRPSYEEVQVRNGLKYERQMAVGLELLIPTRLLKTEPIEGVLGAFQGSVTITGGGAAGAAKVGMAVREGAVIATGANAFARIDLPDGSRLALPSQSRVRVDILHRVLLSTAIERTFTVEAGRSESTVAKMTRPQDNYFVRTPISVSAVRGTDFRVGYEDSEKLASTGVVEGKVGLEAPGVGSVEVPAGFGVGVRPGQPLVVAALLPAPGVLNMARVQDGPTAVFEVDGFPTAKAYRIQLATDEAMSQIFTERVQADPRFEFQLDDGEYYLRVTAIDQANLEGLPRVYVFTRDRNTIDPQGARTEGDKGQRRAVFKWATTGKGPWTYRFQLSRPSAEGAVIDESGLTGTDLTVTNLPPGEYRWRVMSATVRKDGVVEKWTPFQMLTIPAN